MKKTTLFRKANCIAILAIMLLSVFSIQTARADKGWQLVTDASTLSVGDSIIIAAADHDVAISTTQNTNNRGQVSITRMGNLATLSDNVQVFVLQAGGQAGTFAIFDNDATGGYLYAASSSSNYMKTSSTLPTNGSGDWTFTIASNGAATVVAQTTAITRNHMRHNDGSSIFSCYASTSSVAELVAIYKYVELEAQSVETPLFSVNSGIYTTPQQVSITCATAGADIYYTLDGTEPTTASTLYTAPITITTTTTLKAIANVGSDNSFVNSATYTFPIEVANIAAFKATSNSTNTTPYTITGDVTFMHRNGSYMFVKDATGGLLIYDNTVITTTYNEGDIISGGITGTLSIYSNQRELVPLFNTPAASGSEAVSATPVTIADLTANYDQYDAQLVSLQGVTLDANLSYTAGTQGTTTTISQDGSSIAIFNRFKTLDTTIAAGSTIDITGFMGIYGSTIQIYPRNNSDLGEQAPVAPQPSVTILAPANGATFSTLDTLPVELNIQNFVIGTDGTLKVECSLLSEIGMNNPMYFDATAWAAFQNIVLSPIPAGNYTATISLMNTENMSIVASATTAFSVVAPMLPAPTFTVTGEQASAANSYYLTANVSINNSVPGATIYYTTDGSTPTENATLYTAPFDVTSSCTVKAIAVKDYYTNSDVAIKGITIEIPTVATPVFTPVAGTYADSVAFTLTCATPGAEIRYTTDGTTPNESSTLYTTAVTLNSTATVTAKAFKTNWNASEAVAATYTIAHEAALTATPSALNFSSTNLTQDFTVTSAFLTNDITLTCSDAHFTLSQNSIPAATTSATVTVTFDGTAPATGSITLSSDTLTAQVSLTATAQLAMPVIDPTTGASDTMIIVSMSSSNNANIYYTLDGTTPDANATLYNAPVTLSTPGTYTVNAIAMANGWENSEVATATYTIVAPVIPVTIADTLAYYTGFEPTEGFVLGNQYNNTNEILNGTNNQWATVYGTVSTTAPISDTASMQMRWYTNAASTLGYTRTDFDITHATRITFAAKATNGLNVTVSYSTDGGNNYIDSVFALTSVAEDYELIVSETAEYDNVRFKFAIALPETAPTSTSRVYIDSVCIFNFPSMISGTVEMPVIAPVAGTVFDTTNVTITCGTQGASIYYTLDGTTPDENSTLYTGAFDVTSTTTVKAIGIKAGYTNSNIATATYTFPVEVANIAAFKAANNASNNTVYKITGDVTFVYKNNRNMYIQDATGGLLIYDQNNTITNTYYDGDIISGGICGTFTLYNGLTEMVPVVNPAVSVSNLGTVTPVVADMETIIDQYDSFESRLVTLQGVTFEAGTFTTANVNNINIEQDGGVMQCRNQFKTLDMTIEEGTVADVTGFILRYATSSATNYQIAPRSNSDIVFAAGGDTVATPSINVEKLTNDMYAVDIFCDTEGASIYYTVDGTTPTTASTLYNGGFITESGVAIKAIATKEGMVNSAVATYAYTSVENHDNLNISVYPNPTANYCTIAHSNGIINTVMVYNAYGQLVYNASVNGSSTTLNLSQWATGNYTVRIITSNGSIVKPLILSR